MGSAWASSGDADVTMGFLGDEGEPGVEAGPELLIPPKLGFLTQIDGIGGRFAAETVSRADGGVGT